MNWGRLIAPVKQVVRWCHWSVMSSVNTPIQTQSDHSDSNDPSIVLHSEPVWSEWNQDMFFHAEKACWKVVWANIWKLCWVLSLKNVWFCILPKKTNPAPFFRAGLAKKKGNIGGYKAYFTINRHSKYINVFIVFSLLWHSSLLCILHYCWNFGDGFSL